MTITSAAVLLFLVMDPLGNITLFLTELKKVREERVQRVIIRELLVALFILVFFLLVGKFFMGMIHITQPALTVAGGVILFLIAIRMIFPTKQNSMQVDIGGEPLIVPLAIPYVAGPSAMATEMLMMSQNSSRWPEWLLAVFIAWLAASIIIYFASGMRRVLGDKGLLAIERLMGLVLTAISIQMLMTGIEKFIMHTT